MWVWAPLLEGAAGTQPPLLSTWEPFEAVSQEQAEFLLPLGTGYQ